MKHTHDALALLAKDGKRLYALLYRLTLRTDVAEDLLQDLFCRLAQSDGFSRAENRTAFAYRTATNLAFDWRRRRREMVLPVAEAAAQSSSECDFERREEFDKVLNALQTVAEPGREILVMRYLEQQSYDSIAQRFGKTTHQARALAHKALVRLRALLNPEKTEDQREWRNVL